MSTLQILPHPEAHAVAQRGGVVSYDRFRLVFTGGTGETSLAAAARWLEHAGPVAYDVVVDGTVTDGVL